MDSTFLLRRWKHASTESYMGVGGYQTNFRSTSSSTSGSSQTRPAKRHKSTETQPCSSASSLLDRNVHQSRSPRSEKSNVLSKTSGNYPSEQDDISTRASCGSTHDTEPSIQRTNPPSQLSPENENNTRERPDVLIFRSSTGPEQFMMESNYNVYGVHLSEFVVRADLDMQPIDRFLMYRGDGLLSRGGWDVEGMEKKRGFGCRDDEIDLDLL
ncbi:hypothetical protein B0J14DRAFT_687329 [Halenospora varia]|nr:hypothetical protein B0J14DRAFT_687329 [Halenospora varia]